MLKLDIKIAARLTLVLLTAVLLAGCDTGFKQMDTTEYGVRFRKIPPELGGGVSSKVISPGEFVVVWPWDAIYRYDTSLQYLSWGPVGSGTDINHSDYVYTRAHDGNEVALAVTVQYRISDKPEDLQRLVRYVAKNNSDVRKLIQAVARADIRTYMNELKTSEFFDRNARYTAIDKAKDAMNSRLNHDGIIIEKVLLDEHRFERLLKDGTVDASYQEKIDETQKLGQDTERELLRIDTIKAQKAQIFNQTQATVNRQVAEADGYKKQAVFRGDAYLESKQNEALGILAKGKAEVEGLKEKIAALEGEGGKAILKLELAKNLGKQKPNFVVLGEQSKSNVLDVRKIDTNQLLEQIGIVEGLSSNDAKRETDKK